MTVHVAAYAKLNLYLNVCGVRQDGYHDIQSLVQTIDLADWIAVSPAEDLRVSCSQNLDGVNIVEPAAKKLLQEKRAQTGAHIWIEKHIPAGAGLGGGSSDVAAVLSVLNRMIPPVLSSTRVSQIAATIGSDIPLFLVGGCVEIAGRGQPTTRHALRTETFVVLVPSVRCSTRAIYGAWQEQETSCNTAQWGRNDLAAAAVRVEPALEQIAARMHGMGELYAGMTGSGAAFYAAFSTKQEAAAAYETISRQGFDGRVYYCQPTTRGFTQLPDRGHAGWLI